MTDTQLLTACANFALRHTHEAEEQTFKELETSGATRLVNALRIFRLHRAVVAVGMFSMFEALLQSRFDGDEKSFKRLDEFLLRHGKAELAALITDYRLAINVLKHGKGDSYKTLLKRLDRLEFTVRRDSEDCEEGDVSEVGILIDVDDDFVLRCAGLIEQASSVISDHISP